MSVDPVLDRHGRRMLHQFVDIVREVEPGWGFGEEDLLPTYEPKPTVMLYTDQVKKFNDSMKTMLNFAVAVLGVSARRLCLKDMIDWLAKREMWLEQNGYEKDPWEALDGQER